MKIAFSTPKPDATGAVVVGVLDKGRMTPSATALDEASGGAVAKAIKASPRFTGKLEQMQNMPAPPSLKADTVLLVGLGTGKGIDDQKAQRLGGVIAAKLLALGVRDATIDLNGVESDSATLAANLAAGMRLRAYRFDKYRTRQKPDDKPSLRKVSIATPDQKGAKKLFADLDKVVDGVYLTRDLVSEPPNVLYPETFAGRAKELEKLGVEIEILDEKQMRKLGMGALLGVGQGSQQGSRLVVMQWKGGRKSDAPVAIVGKGVTFDTGGISLKPGQGMWDMKWDMGGAGVVTGLMAALAGRKAKVNAVGVIGLVENMPDGNAQRPGDIVTSMSGQTIEVWNTDAEGRLVLADALWYTADRFKPKAMVDLATLTGAMIIALGEVTAGLFANDDALSDALTAAGRAVGEPVWRFPLADAYDRMIDSDVADMKNIAGSRSAGSIVAAQFLQRFVKDTSWAHLDIAGVTWSGKTTPLAPKGGTGFGVRLLDRWVADAHEG